MFLKTNELSDEIYDAYLNRLEELNKGSVHEVDISDLKRDHFGNIYYPSDFKYETQVEEVFGFPVEMGGYYPTKYSKF